LWSSADRGAGEPPIKLQLSAMAFTLTGEASDPPCPILEGQARVLLFAKRFIVSCFAASKTFRGFCLHLATKQLQDLGSRAQRSGFLTMLDDHSANRTSNAAIYVVNCGYDPHLGHDSLQQPVRSVMISLMLMGIIQEQAALGLKYACTSATSRCLINSWRGLKILTTVAPPRTIT